MQVKAFPRKQIKQKTGHALFLKETKKLGKPFSFMVSSGLLPVFLIEGAFLEYNPG